MPLHVAPVPRQVEAVAAVEVPLVARLLRSKANQ